MCSCLFCCCAFWFFVVVVVFFGRRARRMYISLFSLFACSALSTHSLRSTMSVTVYSSRRCSAQPGNKLSKAKFTTMERACHGHHTEGWPLRARLNLLQCRDLSCFGVRFWSDSAKVYRMRETTDLGPLRACMYIIHMRKYHTRMLKILLSMSQCDEPLEH